MTDQERFDVVAEIRIIKQRQKLHDEHADIWRDSINKQLEVIVNGIGKINERCFLRSEKYGKIERFIQTYDNNILFSKGQKSKVIIGAFLSGFTALLGMIIWIIQSTIKTK